MAMEYPIVELTAQGAETVPHAGVDLEHLSEQLVPLRDAMLELLDGAGAKRTVALQRLEVGLSVTRDGRVAFATGNATASLTLTFERRQPAATARTSKPKPAAARKPKAVAEADAEVEVAEVSQAAQGPEPSQLIRLG